MEKLIEEIGELIDKLLLLIVKIIFCNENKSNLMKI